MKYIIVKGTADDLEVAVSALIDGVTVPSDAVQKSEFVRLGLVVNNAVAAKYAGASFSVAGGLVKINDSIFVQAMTANAE